MTLPKKSKPVSQQSKAILAGLTLVIRIVIEFLIIAYHWLQLLYAIIGILIMVSGSIDRSNRKQPGLYASN